MIDWFAPETLERFTQPDAYPEDPSAGRGAAWIQTHLSHLFLTESRVYKLRKSVDLGFVDFTTREERNADCAREVLLNRRLAPDVYLGVAPLLSDGQACWAGSISEGASSGVGAPEHFVVMRRLPADRDALSLLEKGALSPLQIDRVARRIAGFHERNHLGKPAPFAAAEWVERCVDPVEDCFRALFAASEDCDLLGRLAETADAMRVFARRHAQRFEERRLAGRAVDGHGDLHLQHIWFENDDADPVIIDCLEFSERLRQIDTASEVAFTAMDLRYRDQQALADRFLRAYASERDDFGLYGVVDYFTAYRALVRAKVAAITSVDATVDAGQRSRAAASAGRHLELAGEVMKNRLPGSLVLVGGVVGTGKSTVAEALAEQLGGVVISSDRVRKQLAGLPASSRVHASFDEGLYAPDAGGAHLRGLVRARSSRRRIGARGDSRRDVQPGSPSGHGGRSSGSARCESADDRSALRSRDRAPETRAARGRRSECIRCRPSILRAQRRPASSPPTNPSASKSFARTPRAGETLSKISSAICAIEGPHQLPRNAFPSLLRCNEPRCPAARPSPRRREPMPEGIEMAMVLRFDAGSEAPAGPSGASARLRLFAIRHRR